MVAVSCPYCGEQTTSSTCPHCGREITQRQINRINKMLRLKNKLENQSDARRRIRLNRDGIW